MRFLAVDPSLTCSGWAFFCASSERLLAVGKVRSLPASKSLAERLEELQRRINLVFNNLELGVNDVLVCEAQTTMRDPRAAFIVEQVRGIFETCARERHIKVPGRVNPRSVQFEVMGLKGKQLGREVVKHTAVEVAQQLFGESLAEMGFEQGPSALKKHQDIVDALLIGHYTLARIVQSRMSHQPLEEFFSQGTRSKRRSV